MATPELFNPDGVAAPLGRYSHVARVRAGSDLLFIAGQVGARPDGTLPASLAEQAEEAFGNIRRVLASAGLTPANLAKITILVVEGQPVQTVRDARVRALGEARPASTLLFVPQLADSKYLIEVEAVAVA
jgi:enamine deaminase RidA (YjgF/YER057c/UK114 family)